MATIPMKVGDLLPAIRDTLVDQNGNAIDLTGATVTFYMRADNGNPGVPKVIAGAATVISATLGIVQYQWVGTDTDTVGGYSTEWQVTASAKHRTVPGSNVLISKNLQ